METIGITGYVMGIMEKRMESTIWGLGVEGKGG